MACCSGVLTAGTRLESLCHCGIACFPAALLDASGLVWATCSSLAIFAAAVLSAGTPAHHWDGLNRLDRDLNDTFILARLVTSSGAEGRLALGTGHSCELVAVVIVVVHRVAVHLVLLAAIELLEPTGRGHGRERRERLDRRQHRLFAVKARARAHGIDLIVTASTVGRSVLTAGTRPEGLCHHIVARFLTALWGCRPFSLEARARTHDLDLFVAACTMGRCMSATGTGLESLCHLIVACFLAAVL